MKKNSKMLKKSMIWSKNYRIYNQDIWSILVGELVVKFITEKNIFLVRKFETNPFLVTSERMDESNTPCVLSFCLQQVKLDKSQTDNNK